MTAKKRLLSILVAVLMAFAMMPMSAGTVFAEGEDVYTVNVKPGESGDITGIIVMSNTIISEEEMRAGSYTKTAGCFYRGNNGKLYYKLPSRCSFTAPEGKEFDCWEASFGGTFDCGTSIDMAGKGDFTITALWKEPDPDPYMTLSLPETISVRYGDAQTAFDVQVTEAIFPHDKNNSEVRFPYSSFQCTSHDGTIPFTVTTNAAGVPNGHRGDKAYFAIFNYTTLPFNCQGYINITSEDWAAATPGTYTATLKVYTYLSRQEELYREIPLTLVVPDPATVHSVTVNNGTSNGNYAEDGSVTITANEPGSGKRFKEWIGVDGLTFTSGSATTSTATFTMPAGAVTLTATYEDTYAVTVAGGTGSGNYAEGATVTIKANDPAEGQQFKEWTAEDGVTFADPTAAETTFVMPAKAVTVTAKWKQTVNFDPNGGGGTIASVSWDTEEIRPIPECIFTAPSGKVFIGWNTSAAGDGEWYHPGDKVHVIGAETLYAIWAVDLKDAEISGLSPKTYTGKAQTQDPVVKMDVNGTEVTLKNGVDYDVAYSNNVNAGTATVTITGKGGYIGTASATFRINKAANPLKMKAKIAKVKFAKLKKKAQPLAVGKLVTFKNKGQGTRTYKLVSAKKGKKSFKNKFAVNKKNGKLTVKKGLKKGTYKVKINVTAAGNGNFNKVTKPVTVTIKVN